MKLKQYIFAGLLLLVIPVSGQWGLPYDIWQNPSSDDFKTIQKEAEAYFEGKETGKGSGYKQWKRWEYENKDRLSPDGKIINYTVRNFETYNSYMKELEKKLNTDGSRSTANGYWENLGIDYFVNGAGWNPGIGRVNCIAFHPTNPNTFWIGCPAGGLWRTTNGGTTWTCLTDGMPRIGVSGIAIDYNNTNNIYILTGDGDAADTYSVGVLKSTDGGETWYSTGFSWAVTSGLRGFKLVIHPTDPNILLVVSNAGIHRTTNGGVNWTHEQAGIFVDIEFRPNHPETIYASSLDGFYRSTNTGDTWTHITSGTPVGCTRIAISVTPKNDTYVYLMGGPPTATGVFKGVYRSTNSGTSFTVRATTPNMLGYSTTGNDAKHQTQYDLALIASRTDADDVILGGINTWKTTNGGTAWSCISDWDGYGGSIGYTHADIHNLDVNPLNNWVYCCSDGGIFRSTDFGENWTDLSDGLEITQWYRIAGTEANSDLIIGGTQDNGSNKWTGGTTILHILGADGMDCMIDHSNPDVMYYSSQDGALRKSNNGGSSYSNIQPSGSTGSWVTPYIMNPSNSSVIYGGYSDVYKSTNGGSSWTNLGVDGRGAMAMGTSNTNRIYASYEDNIWMSSNAGDSWTNISSGLPYINITYIAVNPDNSNDVFVTIAGYTSGEKVYRSTNAGTSWTNISGSLPNVPTLCIAYQDCNGSPDDALYVGTDIGVFYRNNTMTDWIPYRNGLPTVPVRDLEINYTSGYIRAATYGRGIWESQLFGACSSAYTLTPASDPSNPNYTGFQYYESSGTITSTRIVTGGIGTDVTYKADNYVKLLQGFHAREGNNFKATLGPCEGSVSGPTKKKVTGVYMGNNSPFSAQRKKQIKRISLLFIKFLLPVNERVYLHEPGTSNTYRW